MREEVGTWFVSTEARMHMCTGTGTGGGRERERERETRVRREGRMAVDDTQKRRNFCAPCDE